MLMIFILFFNFPYEAHFVSIRYTTRVSSFIQKIFDRHANENWGRMSRSVRHTT